MPATPSEAKTLRTEGQLEGFNLLLTVISKLTEWPEEARQFLGVGGDIAAEHRLLRADFANARQTAIEAKVIRATEQLRYHLVESGQSTGAERENHLGSVLTYLRYIDRIQPNKNETARIMASVWPWAKMMRAALETVQEGGTVTMVSSGLGGLVDSITEALSSGSSDEAPPPALPEPEPGESEENAE